MQPEKRTVADLNREDIAGLPETYLVTLPISGVQADMAGMPVEWVERAVRAVGSPSGPPPFLAALPPPEGDVGGPLTKEQLNELLARPSPEFDAWRDRMPDDYWARYDLSAAKLGWLAALSRQLPAPTGEVVAWRCFHCDEVFTDERCARLHFGADESRTTACQIKGAEGGLVEALRRAENDAAEAWHAIHAETTDTAKAFFAQNARHQEQLRAVEQVGYDRGIADAKAHPETLGLYAVPQSPMGEGTVGAGTRIYVDCEFNGFGGELISMALVADDGREWYAVLPEPRTWDKWCFENVLPVLSDPKPTIYATGREEFRVSLSAFLSHYTNPTIIADWYVDLVHFFHSFEGRDYEKTIAYACRAELRLDGMDIEPEVPHNALSDARAIRAGVKP